MAYNKTSEERKWELLGKNRKKRNCVNWEWKKRRSKKLRQMDREDFLEERRYREHLG